MRARTTRRIAGRPRVGGALALIAVTGTASGCSLLAVDGPPPVDPRHETEFVCTTSNAIPVVDVLAAAALAVHELGGVGNSDREWTGLALSHDHQVILGMGLATTLAVSAGVGFTRVKACQDANVRREEERRQQRARAAVAPPGAAEPPSGPSPVPGAT